MTTKDDWSKPRGNGTHLTSDEIANVRRWFREGRSANDIARELKCSTRSIQARFQKFREDGMVSGSGAGKTKHLPDRHYRSAFVPT